MLAASLPHSVHEPRHADHWRERITRLSERVDSGPLWCFDDPHTLARALADSPWPAHRSPDGVVEQSPVACVLRITPAAETHESRVASTARCRVAAAAIARRSPPLPLIVVTDDAPLVQVLFESAAWIAGVLAHDASEAEWRVVLARIAAYDGGRATSRGAPAPRGPAREPTLTR